MRSESEAHTTGRHQTLRSEFRIMPTIPWSLAELLHLASVRLGHLKPGQAVVKIGIRPSAQIQTVLVKDGWARPEHVARVTERLAEQTPYVVPVEQAVLDQQRRRRELTLRIIGAATGPSEYEGREEAPPPPLKDEWG